MRKHRSVAALVGAICSIATVAGPTGIAGAASQPQSLTFWVSTSSAQLQGWTAIAADYAKLTGTKINIVNIPYSGYTTKLRDAALAGSLPDVADVPSLDPVWVSNLIDLSSIAGNKSYHIYQSALVRDSAGHVLTIPSDITAAGMFINKSLFEKAHVSFPTNPAHTWTWTQFLAAADKVRKATGAKYDLVFDPSPARLRAFVYEFGGNYMHEGANGKFATTAGTYKALQLFKQMSNNVTMPNSVWLSGADPNALFKSGQVVAYWSGVWQTSDFAESITNFQWASVPTPAQPVQASDIEAGGLMVGFNNSSTEAPAAKKFLTWVYKPSSYAKLSSINGFLPVEGSLPIHYPFKSAAAQASFKLYKEEIALAAPISYYFGTAQQAWGLKGKSITTDPTVDQMDLYIQGKQSVQATVSNIIKGYDQQVGGA